MKLNKCNYQHYDYYNSKSAHKFYSFLFKNAGYSSKYFRNNKNNDCEDNGKPSAVFF